MPDVVPPTLGRDPNPGLRGQLLYLVYDVAWTVGVLLTSPWWLTRSLLKRDFGAMVFGRLTVPLPRVPEPPQGQRRILVHGVSVGEVKASKSLVAALRRQHDVVVSASTNTGMQVARQLYPDLPVVRFPFDHRLVVYRFMRRMRPECVVLMELEIWPNFLRRANNLGVPVAIVSGRITPKSFASYKRFGRTLPQFNRVTLFAAQDEVYAARFAELAESEERILITGNVKVDGIETGPVLRDEAFQALERLAGPANGQPVIVAGSTHEPEERMLAEVLSSAAPGARVILVPRHPGRVGDVAESLRNALGIRPQRLTALRAGETPDPSRLLLVDTIGELERVYGLATLVFVGGTLVEHGGQNMLEPAAQGLPVIYGPSVSNFTQEAALLEGAGAAVRIPDVQALGPEVIRLLADPVERASMGAAGEAVVLSQGGATTRTLAALRERCGI